MKIAIYREFANKMKDSKELSDEAVASPRGF